MVPPFPGPCLGGSLGGAPALASVGAAVRTLRNKVPPTQARVSVSPSLKHHYANEMATSPHGAFLTLHSKIGVMCAGGQPSLFVSHLKCPGAIGSRFSFQKGNHEYKVEN